MVLFFLNYYCFFYHGIGIHHHQKSKSKHQRDPDKVDIHPSLNNKIIILIMIEEERNWKGKKK